jgi:LPXTG-motif cell wall-anchored protein
MIMAALAGLLLAAPATARATKATVADCAAYVYEADRARDLCDRFRGRSDVDCPEVGARVRLLTGADPWNLSQGRADGIGCETQTGTPPPVTRPTTPVATRPATRPATASPSMTASASTSASVSAAPTRARTRPTSSAPVAPPAADDGPTLPVTGPTGGILAGAAALLLAAGALTVAAVRRRRTRFEA